jgi:hypothetical protein
MSLADLSRAYEESRGRAKRAEAELEGLETLIWSAVILRDPASVEWLVALAETHRLESPLPPGPAIDFGCAMLRRQAE